MCLVLFIDVYFSFPLFYMLEKISVLTADMPSYSWPVFSNITPPSCVVHKIDTLSQQDDPLIECVGNQVMLRSLPFYPTKRGITQGRPHTVTCSRFHIGEYRFLLLMLHWLQIYLTALTCPDLYTGRMKHDLRSYSSFPQ